MPVGVRGPGGAGLSSRRLVAGLVGVLLLAAHGLAGDYPAACVCGVDDLVRMSRAELEDLYRRAGLAPVPHGFSPGRAIPSPGSRKTVRQSRLIGLVWKGKVIRPDGTMINRGPLGLEAVRARVHVGESWLDGRPTLVMDYCGMSRLFPDVRDELREVAPGLFLGLTYRTNCPGPRVVMFFVLDARCN
jgi:hypothetical protein